MGREKKNSIIALKESRKSAGVFSKEAFLMFKHLIDRTGRHGPSPPESETIYSTSNELHRSQTEMGLP